ncbi:MAG: roadblock/LC7 domain-containing protein [Rhizobacter sp.]|nr:roadblock/LC7 domain-containing protein [Rhizobacter sp.]
MLTSLFGELGAALDPFGKKNRVPADPARPFAATAILESVATEVNERGQLTDRHQRDLVATGSPAQAMREHFASTSAEPENASRSITLYDPMAVWAASVIKALSDAGGRPIERLNLREQTTLRTLAVIERATLVRRHEDTLKIYHADVRVSGNDYAEIPVALMERSHLTAIIVGPMEPPTVEALLHSLQTATALPTWRCPNLLFLLPPSAVWVANKIGSVVWPRQIKVQVLNEPLTSASSVWNALLGQWNQVKSLPGWSTAPVPANLGVADFPIRVADLVKTDGAADGATEVEAPSAGGQGTVTAVLRTTRSALDPEHARKSLREMLAVDGLVGCAVVDSSNGLVIAREQREPDEVDLERAAAACSQVMRSHRLAARSMGLQDHIDEVMVSAGNRQQVIRTVSRHPELFLFVLLNRQQTNLALARYKLMEVERGLI